MHVESIFSLLSGRRRKATRHTKSNLRPVSEIVWLTLAAIIMTGCVDPQAEEKRRQEVIDRHQRELQLVEKSATADATTQTLKSQQPLIDAARNEGIEIGEAKGFTAAMKDLERREEAARQQARAAALIEGEHKGFQEGLEQGREVGFAEAARTEFDAGQKLGENFGELRGRLEAGKEAEQKITLAESRGESRGLSEGLAQGIAQGEENERRESFTKIASVAASISAVFASLLFFVWTRRDAAALPSVTSRFEQEQLRESRRQMALADAQAQREERLLRLLEQGGAARIIDANSRQRNDQDATDSRENSL